MKFKRLFPLVLSCLFLIETPVTSLAASIPSSSSPAVISGSETEDFSGSGQALSPTSSVKVSSGSGTETLSGNAQALSAASNAKTSSGSSTETLSSNAQALSAASNTKAAKQVLLKLKTDSITIFTENTHRLRLSGRLSEHAKWKSSNPKVAAVDSKGVVTGLKPGTATITASASKAKVSCSVTVWKDTHELNKESQILMQGDSATLYLSNVSSEDSVSFKLSKSSSEVVDISASGNKCKIKGEQPGTVTLNVLCTSNKNNQQVTSKHSCTIQVIEKGISQQQIAMAVKTKKNLTLENVEKPDSQISSVSWVSSHPEIASVRPDKGIVTGKKIGTAEITANVTYEDKTTAVFPTTVKVSNPRITPSYTVLSLGQTSKIKLTGTTPYSSVTWKVKKSSLASIQEDGTVTAGSTAGKTTIIAKVDGKTLQHSLIITNPQLKSSSKLLAAGKKTKFPLQGASSKSRITYKSTKKSVAKVNKSDVITGRSAGNADIIATVDGVSLTFHVTVASQRALQACKTGYSIINSSTYSQARRMTQGYYDCSSLVFRAYGCDTGLLGGIPSWAPTAASMASHMASTGKVIAWHGIDSSKLLPGDLIFYRMRRGSNGRYRNIYHVSMYYGDGYRLEKPLRFYYPESHITMIARPLKK